MRIKYDETLMGYMSLFESLTNTKLKDCIDGEKVLFIVEEGQIGKAIGRQGVNVRKLEFMLKKKIKITEYSRSVEQFIRNLLYPSEVRDVKEESGIVTIVGTDTASKSVIIGRDRKNISLLSNIARRYFPITDVKVV